MTTKRAGLSRRDPTDCPLARRSRAALRPGLSTRTPVTGQQVSPRRSVFALQRWRDCIALELNWHPAFHRLFRVSCARVVVDRFGQDQ
jgi:hypothetical protein